MGNPVFGRADVFQPRHPQQSANHGSPAGEWGTSQQPYLQGQGMVGAAAMGQPGDVGQTRQATMTLDDVIAKTGVVLLVLAAAAALTFSFVGTNLATAGTITVVTSLVSFVTVLIVSARRRVPAGGVMAYALVEGVFIGAFSAVFEAMYPGIVVQAALGTFAAAGVTLAVYKFTGFRVTSRFRRIVTIATFGFAGAMLLNLILALCGINLGIRDSGGAVSGIAIIASIVGVVLAASSLIMDFDSVRVGIDNHAPTSESWRAAFGIAVTMVWLYTEILRILSYFRE
ncbi:MAG: Bax inhibitor-1/YccA family protein [Cutibacterium sp.]|nr:Bax inhibitor-1/YccA family protein [Cutibacterium sp.]